MDAKFNRSITVLPSQVDAWGKLGVAHTFDLFMDVATEAAGAIGVGWEMLLRRGMFWITVKTRIQFLDRPNLLEQVRVDTWPERPGDRRCNRHTSCAGASRSWPVARRNGPSSAPGTAGPSRCRTYCPRTWITPTSRPAPSPFR